MAAYHAVEIATNACSTGLIWLAYYRTVFKYRRYLSIVGTEVSSAP